MKPKRHNVVGIDRFTFPPMRLHNARRVPFCRARCNGERCERKQSSCRNACAALITGLHSTLATLLSGRVKGRTKMSEMEFENLMDSSCFHRCEATGRDCDPRGVHNRGLLIRADFSESPQFRIPCSESTDKVVLSLAMESCFNSSS